MSTELKYKNSRTSDQIAHEQIQTDTRKPTTVTQQSLRNEKQLFHYKNQQQHLVANQQATNQSGFNPIVSYSEQQIPIQFDAPRQITSRKRELFSNSNDNNNIVTDKRSYTVYERPSISPFDNAVQNC